MNILKNIKKAIPYLFKSKNIKIKSPEAAYNLWAVKYDEEKNNLALFYDYIILKELISKLELKNKTVLDYGCGTGRNWPLILDQNPARLSGCDISQNMLNELKKKFPAAEVYKINDSELSFLPDSSCDLIISTFVIAHIPDVNKMFCEWERVLKKKAGIIITDFHPELLRKGGKRTFNTGGELIAVKNYYHSVNTIIEILSRFGFKALNRIEKNIDENVKHFYEKQNGLHVYKKFYNSPFIYGIHLSR